VRFVLHALLAILTVTGEIRIWHLVVIGTIFGSAEAFFLPAISGLLPQTVPEEEIQKANAITRIVHNLVEFAGPALATLLVLGVSAAPGSRCSRSGGSPPWPSAYRPTGCRASRRMTG
jgi:MFS family permease